MNEVTTTDAPDPAGRRTGLVVFGGLQVALGICCAVMLLAIGAATSMAPANAAMPALAPAMLLYAVAASYFVATGIGSIRMRRWARALSAAVSGIWLVCGVLAVIVSAFVIPKVLVLVPPSQEKVVVTTIVIVLAVFFLLVPLTLFLFYRSDDVRRTCEAHDSRVRWTDRVPVPVLALVLVTAGATLSLLMKISRPVVPLFGTIVTGGPGAIILLALAGIFAYLTVQLFRLRESAWWTLLLLQLIGGIAAAITLARLDLNAVYEASGTLTPQVQAMHLEEMYRSPLLWVLMLATWGGYLVFLIYVRRFFIGRGPRTRAADGAR